VPLRRIVEKCGMLSVDGKASISAFEETEETDGTDENRDEDRELDKSFVTLTGCAVQADNRSKPKAPERDRCMCAIMTNC